jgi:hypothetical protein
MLRQHHLFKRGMPRVRRTDPVESFPMSESARHAEQVGPSLGAQRGAISGFAKAEGLDIVVEAETGKSADTLDRCRCRASCWHSLVRRWRPLGSPSSIGSPEILRFASGLMAQHVPRIVAELGANADPFMLHIYAVPAEKERALISERTKQMLARKKAVGALLGKRYQLAEAQTRGGEASRAAASAFAGNGLPLIREIHAVGAQNLRAFAAELTTRAIHIARSGSWSAEAVRAVLARSV